VGEDKIEPVVLILAAMIHMRLLLKSLLLGLLLACLTPRSLAQSFVAAPILDTANTVTDLVSADLRGDGKLDLAFIDSTNTVNVLLGNGDGTFKTGPTMALKYSAFANASNILVGDVNGDGKPDLVVVSEILKSETCPGIPCFTEIVIVATQIDTFLGSGDGTFQASKTSTIPWPSYGVSLFGVPAENLSNGFPATGKAALADFYGNGTLDIAVPEPHNSMLAVFQGDGGGGFHSNVNGVIEAPSGTGYGPGQVIASDLTGNKVQDLVVLTQSGQQTESGGNTFAFQLPGVLSTYLGNGDGSFKSPQQVSATTTSVLVADINGDGHPDLITTQLDNSVQIFLGKGDGTFAAQPEIPLNNGGQASIAGVADYNGDGILDIALFSQDGFSIMLGQGGLSYASPATYPSGGMQRVFTNGSNGNNGPLQFAWNYGLLSPAVFGDFNGDGKTDIEVHAADGIVALYGNGDGRFQSAAAYELDHFSSGLDTADFNQDGIPDIAAAVGLGFTRILLGNGDGTLSIQADPAPGRANPNTDGTLSAGNFDGDGLWGVLGVEQATSYAEVQPGAWVQLGNGNGTLRLADTLAYPTTYGCCGAVGDFNNDGRSDVALVDELNAYFLTSLGGGQFSPFTATLGEDTPDALDNPYVRGVGLGDFNGDGNLDAAVVSVSLATETNPPSETLQILLGNGDGTFALGQSVPVPAFNFNGYPIPLFGSLPTPTIADLNGDGNLDIVLPDAGAVQVFYGNGDGTFQPAVAIPAPTQNFTIPTVADFNLDGIPDLLLTDYGQVSVMYGKGGGKFTAPINYAAGDWPPHPVVVDLNGDGAPDLVFGSGTDAVVMLNIPPPGSLPITGNLVAEPEPSAYHQPFTIIATIKPVKVNEGTPTGSVTFSVDGQLLATSPLAGDTASAVDSQFLTAGTHSVTAVYSGDAVFHSYAMSVQHVVLGMADTITLTGQPNPANLGQNVTFTAQVAGAGGLPTGTFQFLFLDGVTPETNATLNGSGVATFTMFFSNSGPHPLKAHYEGDGTFGANTSAVFIENINQGVGDFQITVTPAGASVQLGLSTTFKVTVTSLFGFSEPVNLTCTGTTVPETSCGFNVNPVTVSPSAYPALSQMTFTTTPPHSLASSAQLGARSLGAGALLAGALLFLWPRRWRKHGLWLVLLAFALLAGPGCSGSYIDPGTPFGTFTINVTGTAANTPTVTHSVPVTITVN
jgi:hypothetical protein